MEHTKLDRFLLSRAGFHLFDIYLSILLLAPTLYVTRQIVIKSKKCTKYNFLRHNIFTKFHFLQHAPLIPQNSSQ